MDAIRDAREVSQRRPRGELNPRGGGRGGAPPLHMKFSRDAAIPRIPAPHLLKQGQLQLAGTSFRDMCEVPPDELLLLVCALLVLHPGGQCRQRWWATPHQAGETGKWPSSGHFHQMPLGDSMMIPIFSQPRLECNRIYKRLYTLVETLFVVHVDPPPD